MRRFALAFVILLIPSLTHAASGPRWSPQELSQFADIVLTGTVVEVTSGWDREVDAIYTYVTLDVSEVLKGDISAGRITVKQLGGAANGVVLSVVDQPTFAIGQEVLLYLEVRPRDGTLYTSALWQGKWDVARGASGREIAVQRAPAAHSAREEVQAMRDARSRAASAGTARRLQITTEVVAGDAVGRGSAGYNLLGPFRYMHVPAIDVQAGGQPGLSGGGVQQVQAAIQRWNSAGSSFRYAMGSTNGAPRCSGQMLENGRVTITFMDPCGEMSNSGGTLAMGGSYYTADEAATSNGQRFDRALEGFVINNDSPSALSYLTNPGCFEEVQTHELGHVLGLHHSGNPDSLMFPTIESATCWNGARGLRADDVQGLLFIYGRSGSGLTPPTAAPADVRVAVATTQIVVSWTDPALDSTASATGYRVDFRAGHTDNGPIVASVRQAGASLAVPIPPGVSGDFSVTVTGINAAGEGPASPRYDFTLGMSNPATTCSAPPMAPTGLTAAISNDFARVRWAAVAGATRYSIQAGSTAGGSDLFAATDLGASTEAGASVPPGFRAWVRVIAFNQCGASAPADVLLQ
jgi:hypothetical protein